MYMTQMYIDRGADIYEFLYRLRINSEFNGVVLVFGYSAARDQIYYTLLNNPFPSRLSFVEDGKMKK